MMAGSWQERWKSTFSRLGQVIFSWLSRHAQVQYTPNYTFNLILFATQGGTPPANIFQAERAEDTGLLSFKISRYSFTAVAGVAFAFTFLNFKTPSNSPLSLPAAVPIYGRDEVVQEVIDKILLQKSDSGVKKHIALRGGPGMGKTTTGIRIMHHPRIARHFRKARHWVSCRDASSVADDLKAQKLIEYISDSLDLDLSGSVDRRKDIRYFLSRNNVPRIIVLDNFETMWDPPDAQEAVEAVLAFLASFPQLTILLTTRNAHDPATQYGVT
jgi:NB-ARC domain